jgi:hypothetical protein
VLCIPVLIAYDSAVLRSGFSIDYRDRLIAEVANCYAAIKPILPTAVQAIRVHIFLTPIECVTTLVQQFGQKVKGM